MQWKALLVGLIAMGMLGMAFAAGPMHKPVGPVSGPMGQEMNKEQIMTQAHVAAINPSILQKLRTRFAHRVKNFDEIVQRAIQRRAEIARAVRISREQIRKWKTIARRYLVVVQKVKETAAQYRIKLQAWYRARRMFEEGNISEEEYLAKAKDMILAAIDATVERLEALKESNAVDVNVERIDEAIARLQDLRAEVEAAEDLDTLRTLYHEEVLPALREYHNRLFFYLYVRETIRAAQSIVMRLDVAAARLARYVDRAKELGIYDENLDARVTTIFAEIDAVKAELNALEAEVEQKDITPQEYITKLNVLKRDVRRIYLEIMDLIRDYANEYAQQIRTRVRERAEVNAPEETNTVRTEAEVEGNVEVEVNA